jgi:hypothetical protein
MFDQVFESFRKASESSLQMQQDMFKQWSQQWLSGAPSGGASTEWGGAFQKRWLELVVDALSKQRESLDAMYRSGIQVLEQTLRLSEIKSPEDYRRVAEDVLRKSYETFKDQSEAQFREFQKMVEKSFDMAHKA